VYQSFAQEPTWEYLGRPGRDRHQEAPHGQSAKEDFRDTAQVWEERGQDHRTRLARAPSTFLTIWAGAIYMCLAQVIGWSGFLKTKSLRATGTPTWESLDHIRLDCHTGNRTRHSFRIYHSHRYPMPTYSHLLPDLPIRGVPVGYSPCPYKGLTGGHWGLPRYGGTFRRSQR